VIHARPVGTASARSLSTGSSARSPWPAAARPISRPARESLTWGLPDDRRGRRLAGRPGGRPWSPPWRRARSGPWRACLLPFADPPW